MSSRLFSSNIYNKYNNESNSNPYSLSGLFNHNPLTKSAVFNRLVGASQRNGIVLRLVIMTPNNPNSAIRHVAKISLYNNNRRVLASVPGIGYLPAKFNSVLVEGGSANDLPTVRLTVIRGVFDFAGLYTKLKRRSIYGAPRLEASIIHRRRNFSHLHL